ncbi:MAG: tetratricopeptide repeat protein, partial [Pirellulaceae bacterium]|nr:tetratricopeptide repeat protein [Pirellulaceae bacterium]
SYNSARARFTDALYLLANGYDVYRNDHHASDALSEGLLTLREVQDFQNQNTTDIQTVQIIQSHQSTALKDRPVEELKRFTLIEVHHAYFTHAQNQIILACQHEPQAASALLALGKLERYLGNTPQNQGILLNNPRRLLFYQAALATDKNNYLAANELGVLYTKLGNYNAAKETFLTSLASHPTPETWHNLKTLHKAHNEGALAQLAQQEESRLRQRLALAKTGKGAEAIAWVNRQTFDQRHATTQPNLRSANHQRGAKTPNTSHSKAAPPKDDGSFKWPFF